MPQRKETLELIRLAGRRDEIRDLLPALKSGQSRLIVGPIGIGKTRLLEECIARSGRSVVRIENPPALHSLLGSMAKQLACRSARYSNLALATSVHLKPLVLGALSAKPQGVIVDNLAHGDPRLYRFLQELYYIPQAGVMVTARSIDHIGHVRKLLWDPREIMVLRPLSRRESLQLFDDAARDFGLDSTNLADFREKALAAARGNPGQIIAMCRYARDPQYRSGRTIKFLPLRMDVLSGFAP